MKKLLFLLPLAFVLGACSKNTKHDNGADPYHTGENSGSQNGVNVHSAGSGGALGRYSSCEPRCDYDAQAINDTDGLLSNRVIYFELNSNDIRPDYRDVLIAHAYYLANNPDARVSLDGHTDERGSPEYNLALGERRAQAVRNFLQANSAPITAMLANSYGEESPISMQSTERAWRQNRRVEINYE